MTPPDRNSVSCSAALGAHRASCDRRRSPTVRQMLGCALHQPGQCVRRLQPRCCSSRSARSRARRHPRAGPSGRSSRTTPTSSAPTRRRVTGRSTRSSELGADTLRVEVKWDEVAPEPASRNRAAVRRHGPVRVSGLRPVTTSSSRARRRTRAANPDDDHRRRAALGHVGRARRNYKPDPAEYGKFVTAVGEALLGTLLRRAQGQLFTIWNEPNHIQFIKPTSQAPRIYRQLVDAAHTGAPGQRSRPRRKIFVGELKPTPRKGSGARDIHAAMAVPRQELEASAREGSRSAGCTSFKKVDADGFAHHPYGPIEIVSKKRDIINLLAIRRLGKALDLAAKAKRLPAHLPIYNTEFGIQSNPPDIFVATSPSRQAAIINQKEEFAYRYPRLKSHSQYQLFDDPSRPGPPAARSGRASRPACDSRTDARSPPTRPTSSRSSSVRSARRQ